MEWMEFCVHPELLELPLACVGGGSGGGGGGGGAGGEDCWLGVGDVMQALVPVDVCLIKAEGWSLPIEMVLRSARWPLTLEAAEKKRESSLGRG